MGISIKHDQVEGLIRRLAAHKGTSLTDAIGMAVRHELEREGVKFEEEPETVGEAFLRRITAVRAEIARNPVLDTRTPDEIIGYDEHGLPT